MFKKNQQNREGMLSGLAMAYSILFLNLAVIAVVGLVIVFIAGLATYMLWILLFGMSLVTLSGYVFYRRLRKEGRSLGETLRSPDFQGRELEISLLGGMANVRLGSPASRRLLTPDAGMGQGPVQIEDTQTVRVREIEALARLLEKNLITAEEFAKAKQRLLKI